MKKEFSLLMLTLALMAAFWNMFALDAEAADTPYVTFQSSGRFTLGTGNGEKNWDGALFYSTDAANWREWDGSAAIASSAGGKLYLRGSGNTYLTTAGFIVDAGWVLTPGAAGGKIACSGNIENLLDYSAAAEGKHPEMAITAFSNLFRDCTSLTSAPALSAVKLSMDCYNSMFQGCTGLTSAPALPATTLADYCYMNMFTNCTSLTGAPELPATNLTPGCYFAMFYGCTALKSAPALPAAILTEACYYDMFFGCSSLTSAPALPAKTLAFSCYENMFNGCTSLVSAPELPATKLVQGCYDSMFFNCTSLTSAPELPATTLAPYCYAGMFQGCKSLTSAPALPATTLTDYCYSDMFGDCTSLTSAPALPATTLTEDCYYYMFYNCTSLTSAPELPATNLAQSCYYGMFASCTGLTSVPALPATVLKEGCYFRMFYNCSGIRLSETGTKDPWSIPAGATAAADWNTEMFHGTGGTFTGDPEIGKVYYRWEAYDRVTRVFGADRYQTAFKAADTLKSELGVSKFDNIIVASGTGFADALAGSYLAAVKNAPILLVRPANVAKVQAYIKDNLNFGGTVYLLGGENAVPKTMETGMQTFAVVRLGGADRYATNLLILKEAGVGSKDIIVCTGNNFADSLSASATGLPILLVKNSLTNAQKSFLAGTSGRKIIVGGKAAVNETVEKQLASYGTVKRLAGNSRYDTSILVAQEFFKNLTKAVLAYSENFPDGLAGGPLAYAVGAPLILTATGRERVAVKYTTGLGIKSGYVLGGPGLISDAVVAKVFSIK